MLPLSDLNYIGEDIVVSIPQHMVKQQAIFLREKRGLPDNVHHKNMVRKGSGKHISSPMLKVVRISEITPIRAYASAVCRAVTWFDLVLRTVCLMEYFMKQTISNMTCHLTWSLV